jgi:dCTP deaminase
MITGLEILEQIKQGNIKIEPFDEKCIGPNSYMLHLADELVIYDDDVIDPKKEKNHKKIIIPDEGYVLRPGELYLAKTVEYTETFNHVPILNGRFSIAALGISIHITAGFGDNGFCGNWTLEIFVVKPVRIYKNVRICHICYFPTIGDSSIKYNGKYLGQKDTQISKIEKEYKDGEEKC